MANLTIKTKPDPLQTLALMREDARFEVGADNDAEQTALASADQIKSVSRIPKIEKTFLSSQCSFNCAYCGCRCGREERTDYTLTPGDLADLAVRAAKAGNRGVFISSAIYKSADYTQELLAETVRIIREEMRFTGYVHAKVMPGADPLLISRTGRYANRLSVNLEVAHSSGYGKIAKQKNKQNILTPMRAIHQQILSEKDARRPFALSQTTQIMAGSTAEDDRAIMTLAQALYDKYALKRVYYTAFQYRHAARGYEDQHLQPTQTPYWRMVRLYQADRLMQLYGFSPEEVTPESQPNLQRDIDPKTAWALRRLDLFPIEINRADYETLLRVPGFGVTSVKKILAARRYCIITHDVLVKMKISLRKSVYFITCNGKYQGGSVLYSSSLEEYLSAPHEQISIEQLLLEQ